jgi:von Willebrand factor type A domain
MSRFVGTSPEGKVRSQPTGWPWLLAIVALCLGITSCGGGGGAVGTGNLPTSGVLKVTVRDTYGVPVQGAKVEATVGTSTQTGITGASGAPPVPGVAYLTFVGAVGDANVTVSRDSFITKSDTTTITANNVTDLLVTLQRKTSPAGGSLTSRDTPVVSNDGQTITFQIELVIVDGESKPIASPDYPDLTPTNFTLLACTPDATNNCVSGSPSVNYTPATGNPSVLFLVPPAGLPQPYAAALMMDQSGSISGSDPTGARLFSAKAFLNGLGAGDHILLSAFASGAAAIPTTPLTVYPPFRDATTLTSAPSYFSTLDSLAGLVGGDTPLYDALDSLRDQVVNNVSLPVGIAKSVVIFTDGDDTTCGSAAACRTRRATSIQDANTDGLRIFTIGLTSSVDFEALGELANQTGGAFLFADNPEQLIPLYGSVGKLLSLSLPTYRLTWTVTSPTANAFQSGNALLGKVQVTAGGSTFDVPFIVGIP